MSDQRLNPQSTKWRFYIFSFVTIVGAFVSFFFDRLFLHYHLLTLTAQLAIAAAWAALAYVTMRIGRGHTLARWIWILTPLAFWPAGVTLFTYAVWKFKGFAP